MRRRRTLTTVLVVGAALAVVACGGDDDDEEVAAPEQTAPQQTAPPEAEAGRTTVELSEFQFDPSDVTVERGATIVAENVGTIGHNFTIERGTSPEEDSEDLAATPTFPADEMRELEIDLEPGDYALVCTVPGHREAGMIGSFTVR